MKLDCYAVLGLSPTAEDAVIRAAYLALMRTYHPDRNGTPEAAARARTITEAYKKRFRQQAVGVIVRPACVSFQ